MNTFVFITFLNIIFKDGDILTDEIYFFLLHYSKMLAHQQIAIDINN